MAAILDDVRAPAAPQPIIYTSTCTTYHRLSTKGEIF